MDAAGGGGQAPVPPPAHPPARSQAAERPVQAANSPPQEARGPIPAGAARRRQCRRMSGQGPPPSAAAAAGEEEGGGRGRPRPALPLGHVAHKRGGRRPRRQDILPRGLARRGQGSALDGPRRTSRSTSAALRRAPATSARTRRCSRSPAGDLPPAAPQGLPVARRPRRRETAAATPLPGCTASGRCAGRSAGPAIGIGRRGRNG